MTRAKVSKKRVRESAAREWRTSRDLVAHVLGDAGFDEFRLPTGRTLLVPSGALYLEQVFKTLVGHSYVVDCLVAADRETPGSQAIAVPLNTRLATLEVKGAASRITKYENLGTRTSRHLWLEKSQVDPDLLAIHHAGGEWSEPLASRTAERIRATCSKTSRLASSGLPRVLVNLSSVLPRQRQDGGERFESAVWNTLASPEIRPHVAIVTSMSTLRAEGAAISRRLSVEQTVEDLCSDLHRYPAMSALGQFGHLFVRIGMVAIVHIFHASDPAANNKFDGHVYFAPYAKDGVHRDYDREGGTLGRNALLIAALAQVMADASSRPDSIDRAAPVKSVCQIAFSSMMKVDDGGYVGASARDIVRATFAAALPAFGDNRNCPVVGWRRIPDYVLARPDHSLTRRRWHILDDVCVEAPVHRINIALAIAMFGYDKVLNRPWALASHPSNELQNLLTRVEYWNANDRAPDFVTLHQGSEPAMPESAIDPVNSSRIIGHARTFELSVPVMGFGRLRLIERDEIESLRSIANLIRAYRQRADAAAEPLCIAVFGPPGSGKSYAVKQLARAVGDVPDADRVNLEFPDYEVNLSQLGGPDQLVAQLESVLERNRRAKEEHLKGARAKQQHSFIPLVFFDEFDSALNGEPKGWLKYFLALMQDGKYASGSPIGPAVFVFAGGVHPTFSAFDPSTNPDYDNLRDSEDYRVRAEEFRAQKGPDFISRLRGHIDVLPINEHAGRPKHFIRRAMQLRSHLEKAKLIDDTGRAKIDDAVAYALLTVDRYRHGVRSMQAILEMCPRIFGRVMISSLPSRRQLEMHVDASEFMIRVHRGRARQAEDFRHDRIGREPLVD